MCDENVMLRRKRIDRLLFNSKCLCKDYTRDTILIPWLKTANSILEAFDDEVVRLLETYPCINLLPCFDGRRHIGFKVVVNGNVLWKNISGHDTCKRHSARVLKIKDQTNDKEQHYESKYLPIPIGSRLAIALKQVSSCKLENMMMMIKDGQYKCHLLNVMKCNSKEFVPCPICMMDDYCQDPLCAYWLDDVLYYVPQLMVTDNRKPHVSPKTGLLCWYIQNKKYEEGSNMQCNPLETLMPLKNVFKLARDELYNTSVYTFGRALVKLIENIVGPMNTFIDFSTTTTTKTSINGRDLSLNALNNVNDDAECTDIEEEEEGEGEEKEEEEKEEEKKEKEKDDQQKESKIVVKTKERARNKYLCKRCNFIRHIRGTIKALEDKIRKGNVDSAISKQRKFKTTEMSSQDHTTVDGGGGGGGGFQASCTSHDVRISKAVIQSGYVSSQERHRRICEHTPINYMLPVLAAVKLVSFTLKSHHHQSLLSSQLGNMCLACTTEGKNAGRNLVFVQGVTITSRGQCLRDSTSLYKLFKFVSRQLMQHKDNKDKEATTIELDSCLCNENDKITIVCSDGKLCNFEGKWPRLDVIVTLIVCKFGISLDFYLDPHVKVGYMGSMPDIMCDPVTGMTSMTRLWLDKYYSQYYGKMYSPLSCLSRLLSIIAGAIPFVQFSNAPKIILAATANRHNTGYPSRHKKQMCVMGATSLCYAQKGIISTRYLDSTSPVQNVFVAYASVGGNNIEDGLIMCKSAVERGLGMTSSHSTASFMCTIADPNMPMGIQILNSESVNVVDKDTKKRWHMSLNEFSQKQRNIKLVQNMSIVQLTNCNSVKSFSYKFMFIHSSSENCKTIVYKNPYPVDENLNVEYLVGITAASSGSRVFASTFDVDAGDAGDAGGDDGDAGGDDGDDDVEDGEDANTKSTTKNKLNMTQCILTLFLEKTSYTVLGDKFSNRHGQKTTVNYLCPQEDMPFFMDVTGQLPYNPDVLINISALKRLTLGADFEGAFGMLSLQQNSVDDAAADTTLSGTIPLGNDFLAMSETRRAKLVNELLKVGVEKKFLGIPLCCGKTGRVMGNADILCVAYEKYIQTSNKVYYCSNEETSNNKQPHTGQAVKSKGRLGCNAGGQMETAVRMQHGEGSFLARSLYDQNELHYEKNERGEMNVRETAKRVFEVFEIADTSVCTTTCVKNKKSKR
jgi:RNA polymerase Rpb2, domain 6